jgi:hypothetical protein
MIAWRPTRIAAPFSGFEFESAACPYILQHAAVGSPRTMAKWRPARPSREERINGPAYAVARGQSAAYGGRAAGEAGGQK